MSSDAVPDRHVSAARVQALLGRLPLFTGLWNDELREMARLCRVYHAGAGAAIFEEGDTSDGMFVVLAGSVEIRTKRSGLLYMTQPGDNFGEIGMISQRKRTASALAAPEAQLLRIGRDEFNRLLGSAPRISAVILRNITEQLSAHLVRMNNRVTTEFIPTAASDER